MRLLVQHAPKKLEAKAETKPLLKFRLTEFYAETGDERAVAMADELLAQSQKPEIANRLPEMLDQLSHYYKATGQYQKAAETQLRIAQYTAHPNWLSLSTVAAARNYVAAGEDGKARELYAQVARQGYGWATGLMIADQANEFIDQSKHEEARRLLSTPVTGLYAEQIQIVLLSMLARSHFETDEWASAERYARQAVDLAESMKLLKNEGLEAHVESARLTLQRALERRAQPMWVTPDQVRWVLRAGERPARQWLKVQSNTDVQLQLVVDDQRIETEVMPQVQRGELFEREVALKLKNVTQSFETTLTIRGTKETGASVSVRISVEVML